MVFVAILAVCVFIALVWLLIDDVFVNIFAVFWLIVPVWALIAVVWFPTIVFVLANSASVALPSNAACNPLVLAIVKSPSAIVFCLASIAACNPLVLAIVKLLSVIVFCLAFNNVV